ncbi:MAG: bifunctional adenosylcobinamide kinase/adenosylcobinamide-phosphate guanylyltransferase [Syntrophomonadaceae bacterium]|nr:bifunctional adenosylcobinamide kinase/adenosylcobinamide-phosphate guanylyltransferase [Syntrophomonadaceae bacterium]
MVTGGARSGKSRFAGLTASKAKASVYYIATCIPQDEEMMARVEHHRQNRPSNWITLEEAVDPARVIEQYDRAGSVFILDCLTLLVSNWLLSGEISNCPEEILARVKRLAETASNAQALVIIVTNEVGWGIVPADQLSRDYRDILGRANQIIASYADEVYLMVSGLALEIRSLAVNKGV